MQNEVAKVKFVEKCYIELEFIQEDHTLNDSQVQHGWDLVHDLDPQRSWPVLLKTAPWSLLDKNAIPVVIREIKERAVVAILIHNLSQKLIGNFTLKLSGSGHKAKLFTDEQLAKDWLNEKILRSQS